MDPREALDLLRQVFRGGEIYAIRDGLALLSPDQPEDAAIVASAQAKIDEIVHAMEQSS